MKPESRQLRCRAAAFSLVELAIVLFIVGILMLSLLSTLSSQVDQRNLDETRRRLDQARELVLSFAIVNGRLPCPARSNSVGAEVRVSDTDATIANRGKCQDGSAVEDYYGGTVSGVTTGLLPAQTIGFQQVDGSGFAIDAWGNRLRYAVAKTITNCSGTTTLPHFTYSTNLKLNGITCQPNDLLVCKSSTAFTPNPSASPPSCGGSGANQIMSSGTVVAIIFSTGKNGATSPGTDEAMNIKTSALTPAINALFVFHAPSPDRSDTSPVNEEFDDQFTWITAGELYGKLISAGVLP